MLHVATLGHFSEQPNLVTMLAHHDLRRPPLRATGARTQCQLIRGGASQHSAPALGHGSSWPLLGEGIGTCSKSGAEMGGRGRACGITPTAIKPWPGAFNPCPLRYATAWQ